MASKKSLQSHEIPANDVEVHQSDTDTVVSAKSKTSGKSSDSNTHSRRLSARLWSFLCGQKNVSTTASTVPMAGPSSEREIRLPEQHINISLFGPSVELP